VAPVSLSKHAGRTIVCSRFTSGQSAHLVIFTVCTIAARIHIVTVTIFAASTPDPLARTLSIASGHLDVVRCHADRTAERELFASESVGGLLCRTTSVCRPIRALSSTHFDVNGGFHLYIGSHSAVIDGGRQGSSSGSRCSCRSILSESSSERVSRHCASLFAGQCSESAGFVTGTSGHTSVDATDSTTDDGSSADIVRLVNHIFRFIVIVIFRFDRFVLIASKLFCPFFH
jgi:hypothetical protein